MNTLEQRSEYRRMAARSGLIVVGVPTSYKRHGGYRCATCGWFGKTSMFRGCPVCSTVGADLVAPAFVSVQLFRDVDGRKRTIYGPYGEGPERHQSLKKEEVFYVSDEGVALEIQKRLDETLRPIHRHGLSVLEDDRYYEVLNMVHLAAKGTNA